jgi:phosphomannomutase
MKKLIVFDLDGTLAESKSSLDAEMSTLLTALLGIVKVAVISGGNWPQFQNQLLSNLPLDERLRDLSHVEPNSTSITRVGTCSTRKSSPPRKKSRSSARWRRRLS